MSITRSITRALTQPLTRPLTAPGIGGGGGGAFSPLSLFASGEQGAWYDPSDFSTMFQDAAGTTPVTAVEQPVGLILDKSGRSNHASQVTAASRPVLKIDGDGKYYLRFDGVDDFLSTGSIDFTSTDKMTVVAGVRINTVATSLIVELSESVASNAGGFALLGFNGGTNLSSPLVAASVSALGSTRYTASATGVNNVLATTVDLSQATTLAAFSMRRNGADAGGELVVDAGPPGVGNFGNHPLYIGSRGGVSFSFNGHLYQLVVRGAATADLAPIETFTADKTGITL